MWSKKYHSDHTKKIKFEIELKAAVQNYLFKNVTISIRACEIWEYIIACYYNWLESFVFPIDGWKFCLQSLTTWIDISELKFAESKRNNPDRQLYHWQEFDDVYMEPENKERKKSMVIE